ncbi:unnamed protein product [Chironomus riparius]|uniref:F-box domain-containing protein n=1 Tax=Chironomus riparius TaxID=315576 RepID=A0A9N9RZZ2_9DIPT|nr:unnamed protein product [Chironomus riparius]
MFRFHPNYKFIQLHKKLTDAIEKGSNLYCLKTEDGMNIRKIFIKILDPTIKIEEVRYLMAIYGEIVDMRINIGHERVRMKNRGYVTYKRCCDATKALLSRKNFQEYFHINAADTWLQPDYIGYTLMLNVNEKIDNNESEILSILDDDCLLHVMSFLEPNDVFMLKKVCSKFHDLADYYFRTIKTLSLTTVTGFKRMTLLEAKLICEKVGKNVTRLTIDSEKFNNQRILSLIPKYFLNVKHLKLVGFRLDSKEFWCQMKKILLSLETLDLSDNSLIHESFMNCFKKSKIINLKSLNVSNSNVIGDFLENVLFLNKLDISGCRNINGRHLIPYTKGNKNLLSLNIGRCPNIYGRALNEMLINAQQLTSITLNNYYVDEDTSRFVIPNINSMINLKELSIHNLNYPPCDQLLRTINLNNSIEILDISYGNLTLTTIYAISTMKKLRKLIMNFKTAVSDDLIDYLVNMEHLEEIHIAGCSHLSAENVLRLFNIRSLKFIDISCCYGFTNDFIFQAATLIIENLPRERLIIHVGLTEIDHIVIQHAVYENVKKYIYLSWKTAKNTEHDYDIDDENNKTENQQEFMLYNLDDIINVLSNIDDCDPKIVAEIKRNL